jgi:hypothetical protein
MEQFIVKFWITNDEGFYQPISENVFIESVSFKDVEKFMYKKYKNKNIEIVSINYC